MTEDKIVRKLRQQLETALGKQKDDLAIELLGQLCEADPKSPRWPHKRGELYRKRNKKREAIDCYSTAADLYVAQGFLARGIAMAKSILDIDPKRIDVLERIDPDAARQLHRQNRPGAISTRPGAMPQAAGGEIRGPAAAHHPAVLAEDPHVPRVRHPALLAEDPHVAVAVARSAAPAQASPAATASTTASDRGQPPHPAPAAVSQPAPQSAGTGTRPKPPPVPPPAPTPAKASKLPPPPRVPELALSVVDLAEELSVAPDVRPNETRFSDAPRRAGIKLDLTKAELTPRKPAPIGASLPAPPPSAKKLSQLPLFPVFAEVPQQAMVALVQGSEILELEDGASVVRSGEPADALYGIIQGSVEILLNSHGKTLKTTLAEGDVFGESCLLAGEKRHADVIARGQLVALKIPRQTFTKVIAAHPRVADILLELLTRRLLTNLLQSSALFREFDARGRQELAKTFEIRRAPRGMVLGEVGKMMDGLYINLTGELQVEHADGRPEEHFGAGTMFGQTSLITREPSDVTVRALANMLVLRLPAKAFQASAMQYPAMLEHVSELAATSVAKLGS